MIALASSLASCRATGQHRDRTRRIMTVPNLISVARLACVPLFLWLLWGADREARGRVCCSPASGRPTGSTATSPAISTRGASSARSSTPPPTGCCSSRRAIAMLTQGLPVAGQRRRVVVMLVREVLIAARDDRSRPGRRPPHRRRVGGQGRHARVDVLVADVPRRRRAPPRRGTRSSSCRRWGFAIGGIILGYYAAAKYVPVAREALREGRAHAQCRGGWYMKAVILAGGEGTRLAPAHEQSTQADDAHRERPDDGAHREAPRASTASTTSS